MTLTRGSFTYASGEEYHGEWKEGKLLMFQLFKENSWAFGLCFCIKAKDRSKLCSSSVQIVYMFLFLKIVLYFCR